MKLRFLRLGSSEYGAFSTGGPPFFNPWEVNIDFPGIELVLGIDPGSNTTAISIGRADSKTVLMSLVLEKDLGPRESTAEQFIQNITYFLDRMCKRNKVKAILAESQFINPKYKRSYRLLTTITDNIKAIANNNGTEYHSVAPTSWKKIYLANYPYKDQINFTESNKKHISTMTCMYFPDFVLLHSEDAADSVGILYYYYETIYRAKGEIYQVRMDMPREYSHGLFMLIMKVSKERDNVLNIYNATVKQPGNEDRDLVPFKITEELSLEDNLRSLTSTSNDVFCAYFKPYMGAMQEIFKNKNYIKELKSDTPLFVLGYRKIKK